MHVPPTSLISTLSLHDALPICGLVLVDDALGGGLVELAGGDLQGLAGGIGVPGGDGRADLADVGLELRLHRAVAQSCLLVRLVSLDLGLDVRSEERRVGKGCRSRSVAYDES